MNQQEIFTYIQKQYPVHPDTITKSGYPVTIFKNPRTAAPYVIFYQSAERTTFMEVQAEPDMIGNYIEMYHLAPAKHMDQKHWLAVPLDGSVSDSKVLDLLDMSYDLVDGQAEADGETGADRGRRTGNRQYARRKRLTILTTHSIMTIVVREN
jgi:predicted DNA-binding protein (MmcQ/YjbR family)